MRSFVAAVAALVLLAGCAAISRPEQATRSDVTPRLPPRGGLPDYQLGGAYRPADGVKIVGRDREAKPAAGAYSICYVNGFQTQPGELDRWPKEALLRRAGKPVIDPDWPEEALLDTSSAATRTVILTVVRPWIVGCAESGFDAVEFDNLDTFTRSDGALTLADNLALATEFVRVAHDAGLAAGQKNAAEHVRALHDKAGFDFALTEECAAYEECGTYTAVYGDHVVDIEYTDNLPRSFDRMCADPHTPQSVVLRDRMLTTPGDPDHVFNAC